ncbi:bifunctional chorismate mutase/prephenate dehydratase [Zhenpiania hominis]|uniref:Bifunctional chorismate mutase/prephenate dehydratase n=1 Tax=Zhenpiania hominis TaxID=2763644 RepID=A0A923SRZ5_9FIRM|nr:bifunctional chorismate mutase/prephenate dehydratase [Zhenpiania hominis]MBC6681206.1 chorismate mutase [Zhenpiania hominis]
MKLEEIRKDIDKVDSQIADLFKERMALSLDIAKAKQEGNLPVVNASREKEILHRISNEVGEPLDGYARILFNTLFDLSRSYQNNYLSRVSDIGERIEKALEETPKLFPKKAVVACQGVEGSYSQAACEKLFEVPSTMYFNSFEGVFNAVEKGLCQYGILPIENSSYGSVGTVYDLMRNYNFHIVKSIRLRINHSLLAKPGTKLKDVKEIFSHEQAIGQCGEFLKTLKDVKITICENTARAAKMVAESERDDVAAICSRDCMELYGLESLNNNIQVSDNNYTRFICISKNLEIYPGANKISLMLTLPHRPSSLYHMIAKFAALGVNLTKLESRPVPGSDFEFMFYFDMEASVYSPELVNLLGQLENQPELFVFLGSYSETI